MLNIFTEIPLPATPSKQVIIAEPKESELNIKSNVFMIYSPNNPVDKSELGVFCKLFLICFHFEHSFLAGEFRSEKYAKSFFSFDTKAGMDFFVARL